MPDIAKNRPEDEADDSAAGVAAPAKMDWDEFLGAAPADAANLTNDDDLAEPDGALPGEDDDNPFMESDEALPGDEEEATLARNPGLDEGRFDGV